MRMFPRAAGLHPPIDANLKHLWTLDESSAAAAAKDLFNAKDLAATASPGVAGGPIGFSSRTFNGSTQWFTSGVYTTDMANLVNMTIVGCVKLSNTFSGLKEFFCYGSNGGNLSFNIYFDGSRLFNFQWTNSGTLANDTVTSTDVFPKGRWIPFGVTRAGASGVVKLYLEGGLAQTWTGLSNVTTTNAAAQYFLGVGRALTNPTPCDLSTLAVYGAVKTDAEMEDIFARMRLLNVDSSLYAKAEVQDGGGTWQDLTSLRRIDFLRSMSIKNAVDQRVGTASFRLMRQRGNMAMARYHDNVLNRLPLAAAPLSTSYSEGAELLGLTRPIRATVDRRPLGTQLAQDAGTVNANNIFEGSIDSTDGGSANEMALECRDIGGRMMDVFVPTTTVRSNDSGVALETVITDAITAAKGTSLAADLSTGWGLPNTGYYASTFWDVNTPTSPGWNVRTFLMEPGPLLETFNRWSEQIGWTFRSAFDQNSASWKMTLSAPARNQVYPQLVLEDDRILDVSECRVAIEDIRTEVSVTFTPHSSVSQPMTVPTIASGTSTAAPGAFFYGTAGVYGPAYTATGKEGNRVVFRVRSDQLHSSESGYDAITKYGLRRMMVAEGATSLIDDPDEAQGFAVAMLRDLQEPKLAMTIKIPVMPEIEVGDLIVIRQNGRWFTTDQKLAVVSVAHDFSSKEQTTSLGLRGRPSGGNSVHLDKETRPGVAPVATQDASAQSAFTAGMTTRLRRRFQMLLQEMVPDFLRVDPSFGPGIRNGGLQSRTWGESPPDTFSMGGSKVWGTDALLETTVVESGQISVKIATNADDVFQSDYTPVRGSETIAVEARTKGASSPGTPRFTVEWFTIARASISSSTSTASAAPSTSAWGTQRKTFVAPSNAAYVRVTMGKITGSGAYYLQWLRVRAERQASESYSNVRAFRATTDVTLTKLTDTVVVFNDDSAGRTSGSWDDLGDFATGTGIFTARETGHHDIATQVRFAKSSGTGGTLTAKLMIYANGATVAETFFTLGSGTGSVKVQAVAPMLWVVAGQEVKVVVNVDDTTGTGPLVVAGAADSWFTARRVSLG